MGSDRSDLVFAFVMLALFGTLFAAGIAFVSRFVRESDHTTPPAIYNQAWPEGGVNCAFYWNGNRWDHLGCIGTPKP